jgi:hypothetical protein
LQGRILVRVPLVLRHPETSGRDDDDLGDIPGEACPKTHCATELLAEVTHVRTARQDVERPIGYNLVRIRNLGDVLLEVQMDLEEARKPRLEWPNLAGNVRVLINMFAE